MCPRPHLRPPKQQAPRASIHSTGAYYETNGRKIFRMYPGTLLIWWLYFNIWSWSKSFFFSWTSPRHSTQHYQDIIIDGGGDQGCGENEGRDVGGQASSDWGCCLPTFSLLLHTIAWHPLVLHGIADTACDRGCVRCPIKSQLPILGRSKTLR